MVRTPKQRPTGSVENEPKRRRTSRGVADEDAFSPSYDRTAFKAAWRVLLRAGWYSKKPPGRGLSDLYRYVRNGCDANGEAGVDYFLGEAALLEYYNGAYGANNTPALATRVGSQADEVDTSNYQAGRDIAGGPCTKSNGGSLDSDGVLPSDSTGGSRTETVSGTSGVRELGPGQHQPHSVDPHSDASAGINGCELVDTRASGARVCGESVSDEYGENRREEIRSGTTSIEIEPSKPVSSKGDDVEHVSSNAGVAGHQPPPNRPDKVAGSTRLRRPILCAVCSSQCTMERSCTWCGNYIHHFCSHDVCLSLNLRDANGESIVDFGESSYCSQVCYTRATTPASASFVGETTLFRAGEAPLENLHANLPRSSPLSDIRKSSQAAVPSRPNAGGRGKGKKPLQTPQSKSKGKAPLRKSQSKRKVKASQPKKKTAVNAMKEELLRRAHEAAMKYIDASVAFCPADEEWMPASRYRDVGAAYLTGVVTRYNVGHTKNADGIEVPATTFEIHWTSTAFQTKDHVHCIPELDLIRGIRQFVKMQKNSLLLGESWQLLCNMVPQLSNIPALTEEFEEVDDQAYREWSDYRSRKELQIPLSPGEAEEIESMTFSRTAYLGQPIGLFTHADGTSSTILREESRQYFGHSATSAFFAFVPLSFWNQVVVFSNEYAAASGNPSPREISLDELMKFLGILWYMTLFDKGEMRNYWTDCEETTIFPGARSTSLGTIMTWRRFLYIRQNLCFRSKVTTADIERDPAARIRPLISIVKSRCSRHGIVGRNVAVDEASVACRSRYARHIIVYNPRKPTGKYHFKFYMCCCSTSWYVVNFKLHCSSDLCDRLESVASSGEIAELERLTAQSSEIRSHVIEVTASLKGSCRIVNTDNFYTSCLLLESLRSIGLYGRGTVRTSSKHFPHFTMIRQGDAKPRGFMKQGVCVEKHIVAASWVDGSIVNIVSNADASDTTTVFRRIKNTREPFSAPTCISEYNGAMQGVDRHDQLRGRFSLCGGHSFQKWHKKLAMSLLDIARCNAFICDELARGNQPSDPESSKENCTDTAPGRDRHRAFVVSLVRELFSGEWKKWIDTEDGMVYAASNPASAHTNLRPDTSSDTVTALPVPPVTCVAKEAWLVLKGKSRTKRECTICKFECRNATQKTDFCLTHQVALCKRAYPVDHLKPHLCQEASWTCWQKFHYYYVPKEVYTADGNLKRSSPIYKAQAPILKERRAAKKSQSQSQTHVSTADATLFAL